MKLGRKFQPVMWPPADGVTVPHIGEILYQCPACGAFFPQGRHVTITEDPTAGITVDLTHCGESWTEFTPYEEA